MSLDNPTFDDAAPEVPREPWSYGKFVEHYNIEANRRGCWPYIEDEGTPYLQKDYENPKNNHRTLKAFAVGVLEYEQIYTDDVLPKFKAYKTPEK